MDGTPDRPEHVIVVGAGECGARAVAELRGQGFAGSVTLIGEESRLPYERPPLSKAALTDGADDEGPQPVTVADEARFADLEVTVHTSTRVTGIDRERKVVVAAPTNTRPTDAGLTGADTGRWELPYDRLLLATGAGARPLPIEGAEHALLLRSFEDAVRLRAELAEGRHVVVVGAGFIGLEVAASARQRGCRVTVLELAPRALARAVPAELADALVTRHRNERVNILFDTASERIVAQGDNGDDDHEGFVVELSSGHKIRADLVVAGVGAQPNVELAAEAGLDCDNGIAVDDQLRTSDPDIFAAGDCCSFPHGLFGGRRLRLESWRNAHDQAVVAAANLLGGNETYLTVPWFWSDQYDLGLQLAGFFDAAASTVTRHRPDGVAVLFGLADDGRLVAAAAVGTGASVAKDVRLAEMMIAKQVRPDPDQLTDPEANLKQLLRAEG